jgi:hypothetical protein
MAAAISEFLRLFYDRFGPIPLLVALLCCAGLYIWHQRGRIRILLDRLDLSAERSRLMEERKLYSEEKRKDAEKKIAALRQLKRRRS